jgi:aldose 1-epimerase
VSSGSREDPSDVLPRAGIGAERVALLADGPYRASVTEVGAALVSLTCEGRPLLYERASAAPDPRFRGAILAPWPNRIRDGRYGLDGVIQQLPLTEPSRGAALHGLVVYHSWELVDHSRRTAAYETRIWPQPGYPFTLALRVEYELSAVEGLRIRLSARNVGTGIAPYGASIHPYLSAGEGTVDDWTFHTHADRVVTVDEQRLLPTGVVTVQGSPFDFRAPAALAGRVIDHALTALGLDQAGKGHAVLLGPDGRGVRMTWQEPCRWLQVHTTDLPGQPSHRRGLAVEPMTCPPDAFNSGEGVLRLEPGASSVVAWWIARA